MLRLLRRRYLQGSENLKGDGSFNLPHVVEEPAQNLFPESQMKNLAFLLEAANVDDENKIVITTHSSYVLSYITLAAKSYELMNKGVKCDFSMQKQNERQ